MLMKKTMWFVAAFATLLAGCASNSTREHIAKDEVKAMEVRADAAKVVKEKEQRKAEEMISSVPAWALEPPKPDGTGVFAVGLADSEKLPIALRKAMLQGEFGLAKIYNQEISGSERSYVQDNGKHGTTDQFTGLIDKLVMQVPITGVEIVKQEVKAIDGTFHAFVLVKLPYEQFNQVLQSQRAKTRDATIAAAYDDLERRIDKRRKQRIEEAAAENNAGAARAPVRKDNAGAASGGSRDVGGVVVGAAAENEPPQPSKEE